MYQIEVEYTDTFGGEPNYNWVRRETIEVKAGASKRQIMRMIKAFAGLSGVSGRSYSGGDHWEFRPAGRATVVLAQVIY